MKSQAKIIIILSVVLIGIVFIGGYMKMQQFESNKQTMKAVTSTHNATSSANTVTELAKNIKLMNGVSEQLMSRIDQIKLDIIELQKNTNVPADSSTQVDVAKKTHQLSDEIETLRKQLTLLTNKAENYANLPQAESSTADEGQGKLLLTEEEREIEVAAQMQQQLEIYDNAALQEGVDDGWASQAQTDVYNSFQTLSTDGVSVSEVACHRSFCQAKFSLDGENNDLAIGKVQKLSPWEGESFIWIKDIEQGDGVIYLARQGQVLP
jgi:hypothetical protein